MRRSDLVFFLSGTAALVYETIWARLLARVLGHQASATAVILAVFMAGLGFGAWSWSERARSAARPQALFARLEAFIGVWAAASPWILAAITPVDGFGLRALVCAGALLPPTIAMGATFPVMGRLTVTARAAAGRETSGFYGANTLGAGVGVLLGAGLFMPLFGLGPGLAAASVLSFAAALLALTLEAPGLPAAGETVLQGRGRLDPFLLVPLCLGCSSLALEVVLTRLLVTVTGASVYAFAIVLAVFLLGIGLGSRQAMTWLAQPGRGFHVAAACAAAIPILALVGALILRWHLGEADLFASLGNRLPAGAGPLKLWLSHALLAALVLLPPAVAFGVALPACVDVALERTSKAPAERVLGRVYAANTLGALLGSLGAGFFLMPAFSLRGAFHAALLPCFVALAGVPKRKFGWGLAALLGAAGAALLLRPQPAGDDARPRILHHRAGLYEMVAVEETTEADGRAVRSFRLNGKVEASTAPVDVRLQRLLGHIPGLLHGSPTRALCIGTGTGMTAGALLDLPTVESVDVFEIEPAVPDGTRWFADWNNGLVGHPKVRFHFSDGRHLLFRSDERWDLITADPLHVWSRGSSDLYTLEYYRRMASRLTPGGLASQWIGLYELSLRDVQIVVSTWCAAFPHARAYLTAYDFALIGSNEPFRTDWLEKELPPAVRAALAGAGVHSAAEVEALLVGETADLRELCAGVDPMRDARPILEFRAPLSFHAGYSVEALRWCARASFVERLPAASRPRAREVRALLLGFLDRLPAGWSAAAGWYGRELLALPATG
jgi:spermidine synthase